MTKQILLYVDYQDNSGKFWQESNIKSKIFTLKDNQTIDELIAEALKDNDYMEMSYKGKPVSNIYVDRKDGTTKAVGYIYRVKNEIENKKAYFDAWITIKEVIDYPIKVIN